jgi:hypothetical protein
MFRCDGLSMGVESKSGNIRDSELLRFYSGLVLRSKVRRDR